MEIFEDELFGVPLRQHFRQHCRRPVPAVAKEGTGAETGDHAAVRERSGVPKCQPPVPPYIDGSVAAW